MKYRLIGHNGAKHGTSTVDHHITAKNKKVALEKANKYISETCDYPAYRYASFVLCKEICKIKGPKQKHGKGYY